MLTSLMGVDHLSAAMSQPSLGAIQQLLTLVLQPTILQLERESPDHPKLVGIRNRLAIYDAMVKMPPAHGKSCQASLIQAGNTSSALSGAS
jgi:hypothetical protein